MTGPDLFVIQCNLKKSVVAIKVSVERREDDICAWACSGSWTVSNSITAKKTRTLKYCSNRLVKMAVMAFVINKTANRHQGTGKNNLYPN